MPDIFTGTLNLCKVGINESDDTWGNKLNSNCDLIDADALDTDTKLASLASNATTVANALAGRLTAVEGRTTVVENRVTAVEGRTGGLETRTYNLEIRAGANDTNIQNLINTDNWLAGRCTAIENRLAAMDILHNRISFYGEIRMWAGSIAQIPDIGGVGSNSWRLCNGGYNTPNLLDRFIVAAGSGYGPWAAGGGNGGTTESGWHSHSGTTAQTVLSWNEMPVHSHGASTSTNGVHGHSLRWTQYQSGGGTGFQAYTPYSEQGRSGDGFSYDGDHNHTIYVDNAGGNWGHGHALGGDGSHTHAVDVRPAYFALCYIMRMF